MWSKSGDRSLWLIFWVATTVDLCSSVPIGMISVFSMLNLAPDTLHQWLRISWTLLNLSCLLRYRVVSSANMVTSMFLSVLGGGGLSH